MDPVNIGVCSFTRSLDNAAFVLHYATFFHPTYSLPKFPHVPLGLNFPPKNFMWTTRVIYCFSMIKRFVIVQYPVNPHLTITVQLSTLQTDAIRSAISATTGLLVANIITERTDVIILNVGSTLYIYFCGGQQPHVTAIQLLVRGLFFWFNLLRNGTSRPGVLPPWHYACLLWSVVWQSVQLSSPLSLH